MPYLQLGERAGPGWCCPGCWAQQLEDLEFLLATATTEGDPVRLLADFADVSLIFVANHTVDTSPVNRECTEPAVINKPSPSSFTKC